MSLSRNQIIIIGAIGIIVLFFILLFLGVIPGLKKSDTGINIGGIGGGEITELNFWGVFDDQNIIQSIITEYLTVNQNVRINYRQFDNAVSYEKALLNALATGQAAPDIFMFHNTWLPKHYDKITPVSENQLSLAQFHQLFPLVVEQDFVLNQKIYALPLYIDSLALLYNKDVFDAQAIALPPANWREFQSIIPQLRKLNPLNQISQPAAAIGGSEKSINSASDLLNLLIMQFGSQIIEQLGRVSFDSQTLEAFNFYLQFANPSSPYYTWNDNLRYSLDSFADGSLAIIFNYASQISLIKNKNPFLRIGVAPMLQFFGASQPINYANYWGLTVSNQSRHSVLAWDFIIFATTNPTISETYLQLTNKPPALRLLIEKYKNDPGLGVFAKQALTARSWPQPDNEAVRQIFSNMIESVLTGRLSPQNALSQAENEINALIYR